MSKLILDAQIDQIRRELQPLIRQRAEMARQRVKAAKAATQTRNAMWAHLQEQWDANRRRGPIPPLYDFDPYAVGPEWWREQI